MSLVILLVGWSLVLWHINICGLFNAKFIFIQTVLFQTIQFSIEYSLIAENIFVSSYSVLSNGSHSSSSVSYNCIFVHTQLHVKAVLLQTIQFSISTQFRSIWSIDQAQALRTRVDPGALAMKGVLRVPQSSSIAVSSLSDRLVSYQRVSLGKSYSSAEMKLVYSTAIAD